MPEAEQKVILTSVEHKENPAKEQAISADKQVPTITPQDTSYVVDQSAHEVAPVPQVPDIAPIVPVVQQKPETVHEKLPQVPEVPEVGGDFKPEPAEDPVKQVLFFICSYFATINIWLSPIAVARSFCQTYFNTLQTMSNQNSHNSKNV